MIPRHKHEAIVEALKREIQKAFEAGYEKGYQDAYDREEAMPIEAWQDYNEVRSTE